MSLESNQELFWLVLTKEAVLNSHPTQPKVQLALLSLLDWLDWLGGVMLKNYLDIPLKKKNFVKTPMMSIYIHIDDFIYI